MAGRLFSKQVLAGRFALPTSWLSTRCLCWLGYASEKGSRDGTRTR